MRCEGSEDGSNSESRTRGETNALNEPVEVSACHSAGIRSGRL